MNLELVKQKIVEQVQLAKNVSELSSFLRRAGHSLNGMLHKKSKLQRKRDQKYQIISTRFRRYKTNKLWTAEEEEKLKELWPKHSALDVAKMLGRTYNSINMRAQRLGLRKNGRVKHLLGL